MRITVIGTGYVGLVTGVCLAETGNQVVGCDTDEDKIATLRAKTSPIYEPGLEELLKVNMDAGRIRFTSDTAEAVRHAQVIFIAIGTPSLPNGAADISRIKAAVRGMAKFIDRPRIVVMKSTVPVGTGDEIEALLRSSGCQARVDVVSNPEFLKEGSAVDDFQRPDRVVIGAENPRAGEIVRKLYLPFVRNRRPIIMVRRKSAEMTKYAANACLAMRISFINQIATLCEHAGVEIEEVIDGIGADRRIRYEFLYPGIGYGGSCFPKDVRELQCLAERLGAVVPLIRSVHTVNEGQKRRLLDFIDAHFGPNLRGRTIAVWGCSFKPKTDDIREAPAVVTIKGILKRGGRVKAHDPKAGPSIAREFGAQVTVCRDQYEALTGADALAICTEWHDYRSPDFGRMRRSLRHPVVFDGRNVYNPGQMRRLKFDYYSIGRPPVVGTRSKVKRRMSKS